MFSVFGAGSASFYQTPQIDGKRDTTSGNWFYYSYGIKTPAFTGLDWGGPTGPNTSASFDCLAAWNYYGKFHIDGLNCTSLKRFVCEF